MAAADYASNVMQNLNGQQRPGEVEGGEEFEFDKFILSKTNFIDWLHVWVMFVEHENPNNKDIFKFANEYEKKFTDLVEKEIKNFNHIKLTYGLEVEFSQEDKKRGIKKKMTHYFYDKEPHILNRSDSKEKVEQTFDDFIEQINGEIENWSAGGSGWNVERTMSAYVNVARYNPLRAGTFLPLPAKLAKKKAIINVKNNDNECLKWAIRAALFPVERDAQRKSKYPVNDGINYQGIDFPTPLNQIEKLEKQNPNLAINVFGWENDFVTVHRISKKEKSVPRICLMLIESGEIQHYCFVKRVTALLYDQSKSHNTKHYCMLCLTGFSRGDLLEEHEKYCNGVNGRPTRIEMPEKGKNKISFQNYYKQMRAPYIIYADFEALLFKISGCSPCPDKSYTEKIEKHEACGYSYVVVRSDGEVTGSKVYRGENAVGKFLSDILEEEEKIREDLAEPEPVIMEDEDWKKFKTATDCHICNKSLIKENFVDSLPVWNEDSGRYLGQSHKKCFYKMQKKFSFFTLKKQTEESERIAAFDEGCIFCKNSMVQNNYRDAVKDHCHITGKFRGAAHNACNLKLRINPKTIPIPVVFHNLRGYDAHHLMQAMSQQQKEVKCIANNMEKYITFSVGNLRFIDSFNFMSSSLDKLVGGTPKELLKITSSFSNGSDLLYKKGIYPYEYMDSWERFGETKLPEKERFFSNLNEEHITDEEYKHAQKVWETFGCQTLGDYHNLYVKTDASLLADVFENFRNVCQEKYGLDPAHYFTSPGLAWDALLKLMGVELELFTDLDMYMFIERGMRGGISMASKRYAKANNPLVPGYDPKQPKKHIMYLDANNLYGWAMSKPLPIRDFKWKRVMPTEKQIMSKREDNKHGWILEVDLEYTKELHEKHNSYPLAPEKRPVKKEWMSEYQNRLIEELDLKFTDNKKLLLTLMDKKNYVVHYRNLQFYLEQGMKLKKVHKVLEFEQERWMEPYIRMNTEFRKKARNDFEKDFFKLMNNSVFGKTMENLRNRVDIKIVRNSEENKIRKLVASPLYSRFALFTKDMAGIHMHKSKLLLNKPVYTGMAILDNSKILMYEFFYNFLKRQYGEKCNLLYTDTDSLLLEIETDDIYRDIEENKDLYDTSDYPKDHPLHSTVNKKVLGKMKDECAGTPIAEVVCLRSKMYSILKADEKNTKKAKGVKKCVVQKQITHEHYKETLLEGKQLWHGQKILRSEGHEMYSMHLNKISLSAFDSKRWIADDGVNTNAYGYIGKAQLGEIPSESELEEMADVELGEITEKELGEIADILADVDWTALLTTF